VIDRHRHAPLEDYLANKYFNRPFDVVIDAHGSQPLFRGSPMFLKNDCDFVTVGVAFEGLTSLAMLRAVYKMLTNIVWPRAMGGTPRNYVQITSLVDIEKLIRLRSMCEDDDLKVVVDSLWKIEETHQVR
jgi:hypothetical protein